MVWQRTDDQYGISKKITRLPRKMIEVPTRLAAVGLDQLAMNYSVRSHTDGVLDENELGEVFATDALIDALVAVERWHREGHDCARCVQPPVGSIVIHDFLVYNPDAASVMARSVEKSLGGREGNHRRWHAQRGISVPGCEWCAIPKRSVKRSKSDSDSESAPNPPGPVPVPRQTDITHLHPVPPVTTVRATNDEDREFIKSEAQRAGIKNLPRVLRAIRPIIPEVTEAQAIDITRSIIDLATDHVASVEAYVESACRNSPEQIRQVAA